MNFFVCSYKYTKNKGRKKPCPCFIYVKLISLLKVFSFNNIIIIMIKESVCAGWIDIWLDFSAMMASMKGRWYNTANTGWSSCAAYAAAVLVQQQLLKLLLLLTLMIMSSKSRCLRRIRPCRHNWRGLSWTVLNRLNLEIWIERFSHIYSIYRQ